MPTNLHRPFNQNYADVETYNIWLQLQVDQRLTDNKQVIPHDVVMKRLDALLDKLKITDI